MNRARAWLVDVLADALIEVQRRSRDRVYLDGKAHHFNLVTVDPGGAKVMEAIRKHHRGDRGAA